MAPQAVSETWRLSFRNDFSADAKKPGAHMGVSENNGTPKSSILIGFSIIYHPFWGTSIFGNTHIAYVAILPQKQHTGDPNPNPETNPWRTKESKEGTFFINSSRLKGSWLMKTCFRSPRKTCLDGWLPLFHRFFLCQRKTKGAWAPGFLPVIYVGVIYIYNSTYMGG